ncbi:MAG TPA: YqaJ viral recombinase family protein [Alphaproteobacteria bacterium]|nr:YqaJ viral recombinase family protein [Alphaproteobacteria bacterium]
MAIERWTITDRAEWLERRRPNINGSEVGALFGCNPYLTRFALHADKAGLVTSEPPDNDAMRRGRILEPAVEQAVKEYRPELQIWKSQDYVWSPEMRLGCTPDFYVSDETRGLGVLQAKTVAKPIFEEEWASGPPKWIILQTLQEMMLTECAWGVIAALVLTSFTVELQTWDFQRHAGAEEKIRIEAGRFWTAVAAGEPPAPNYAVDGDTIKALFPRDDGPALDLSADNRMPELLDRYEQLQAMGSHAEKELKAIKAEIAEKMGAAALATLPGWQVTHKLQHRKETVQKASSYRVLRVKRIGEKEEAA